MAHKDETWRDNAACKGQVHLLKILFLERGQYRASIKKQVDALCQPCPVREQCLQFAYDNDIQYGTFGGLNAKQRKDLAWHRRRESLKKQGKHIYDYL